MTSRVLLDLPDHVLAKIAKCPVLKKHRGHPFLAVGRELRDTVLGALAKAYLALGPDDDAEALAGLLGRICSTCKLQLSIAVYLSKHGKQVLDHLLQTSPGWQTVHHLILYVSVC
jgi:hypothetical protein